MQVPEPPAECDCVAVCCGCVVAVLWLCCVGCFCATVCVVGGLDWCLLIIIPFDPWSNTHASHHHHITHPDRVVAASRRARDGDRGHARSIAHVRTATSRFQSRVACCLLVAVDDEIFFVSPYFFLAEPSLSPLLLVARCRRYEQLEFELDRAILEGGSVAPRTHQGHADDTSHETADDTAEVHTQADGRNVAAALGGVPLARDRTADLVRPAQQQAETRTEFFLFCSFFPSCNQRFFSFRLPAPIRLARWPCRCPRAALVACSNRCSSPRRCWRSNASASVRTRDWPRCNARRTRCAMLYPVMHSHLHSIFTMSDIIFACDCGPRSATNCRLRRRICVSSSSRTPFCSTRSERATRSWRPPNRCARTLRPLHDGGFHAHYHRPLFHFCSLTHAQNKARLEQQLAHAAAQTHALSAQKSALERRLEGLLASKESVDLLRQVLAQSLSTSGANAHLGGKTSAKLLAASARVALESPAANLSATIRSSAAPSRATREGTLSPSKRLGSAQQLKVSQASSVSFSSIVPHISPLHVHRLRAPATLSSRAPFGISSSRPGRPRRRCLSERVIAFTF